MSERLRIRSPDGEFDSYVARPAGIDAPGVVVIQDIFGVDADMRETCDELGSLGYLAVCPDLFWRIEPGIERTDVSSDDMTHALANYAAFDVELGIADIGAAIATLRRQPDVNGKVGVVGFGLGGLISFFAAVRGVPDVGVSYYGSGIECRIDEARTMTTPFMLHLAGEDEFMPPGAQERIRAVLDPLAQVEVEFYPRCRHAFARRRGAQYDAAAAVAASRCTMEFLRAHLF